MGLRVEEDHHPSSIDGSQSTIVISILYIYIYIYISTTHFACYFHIASIWSLSLLCIHAYHTIQCIYYYRSQPKQVLLEAVQLVDMEKELELELEKELEVEVDQELVVCRTFDC